MAGTSAMERNVRNCCDEATPPTPLQPATGFPRSVAASFFRSKNRQLLFNQPFPQTADVRHVLADDCLDHFSYVVHELSVG